MLRPPSTGSQQDLDGADDREMEDLARLGAQETGFPVTPVVAYHPTRRRDISLRGHFHDFGYHNLGLFVFEFELGIIQNSAGISTEEQFAAETEADREAQMRRVMAWWDRGKRRPPLFQAWKPFDHPQLGPVELGGFRAPYLSNPTLRDLMKISKGTYRFTVKHAERHPLVVIEDVCAKAVGGDVIRVRARVANRGEFPTHVTNRGRSLARLRPVRVEFHPGAGVQLLSAEGHVEAGHLPGVTGSRDLEWFVSAPRKGKYLCGIRVLGGAGGNASVRVTRPRS